MSSEDKYARSVAKLVAGQLMAAEGLDSAQRSTLEILSDLLVRYIVEVGAQSHMYAELSHRTECSPTDVVSLFGWKKNIIVAVIIIIPFLLFFPGYRA